jgi:3-isopropylmalate/(R)-2-methylmalate dehydratase large subunit
MAYVLATGQNWFRVPETIEFVIEGEFPDAVDSKDLMLHIAGTYGTDVARYKSIEFNGPGIRNLSVDSRITLSNMSIELGAMFGFVAVDETVLEYVEKRTDEPFEPAYPQNPDYSESYHVEVSSLEPQIAIPHNVQNVHPISDVDPVRVDQVFIGSCTNGKLEDLRTAARILDGRDVASMTRLIITPASRNIYQRAEREGIIEIFHEAGAVVTNATCGACPGLGVGVLGEGEVCLAAQNRNFRGRMGHDDSEIFLSSSATAAATATTGRITDPRAV